MSMEKTESSTSESRPPEGPVGVEVGPVVVIPRDLVGPVGAEVVQVVEEQEMRLAPVAPTGVRPPAVPSLGVSTRAKCHRKTRTTHLRKHTRVRDKRSNVALGSHLSRVSRRPGTPRNRPNKDLRRNVKSTGPGRVSTLRSPEQGPLRTSA